jgi:hypothetical protein
MTRLLQKDETFNWTPECEAPFRTLRKLLTTAPVLAQLEIIKPFDVYCDASGIGLGCVLELLSMLRGNYKSMKPTTPRMIWNL